MSELKQCPKCGPNGAPLRRIGEMDDQILIHCDSLDALFDCIGTELECGYTFDIVDANYRTLHPAAIWCMYAIVWAIRQYDKAKESKEQK